MGKKTIQMPQMSGLELCQRLRSAANWQKLPVMFLSVFADAKTQHDAFAAGADDYLYKPITAQVLGDRIHQRLHRIQAFSGYWNMLLKEWCDRRAKSWQ